MRLRHFSLSLAIGCAAGTGRDASTGGFATDQPPEDVGSSIGTGDDVYRSDRVLQVDITVDPDAWDDLRYQERDILSALTGECQTGPFESPYEWFPASITIDGETFSGAEIRKKGLLGSVTSDRPSLKVDLDEYAPGAQFEGLNRLTLNNGRQDPSRIRQCLGYDQYARAGLPASRCGFAHVTVNGTDLGLYSNIEPVKPAMLARHFEDGDGSLYEGTLSDFRDGWANTFDPKTDAAEAAAGADIAALIAAMDADDDDLLPALDGVMDVDQFMRWWAMDALIAHWDGYAANTNNFFIYAPESDGRFRFVPWGIDAILTWPETDAVFTSGALANRLAGHADAREMYTDALQALLDDSWDEEVLGEELERMTDISREYAWPHGNDAGEWQTAIFQVDNFIDDRRDGIGAALDGGLTRPAALRANPCLTEAGTIELDFTSTWGSYGREGTFSHGDGSWTVELGGAPVDVDFRGAVVGESGDYGLILVSGQLATGEVIAVYAYTESFEAWDNAGTHPLDWQPTKTYLLIDQDGDYADFSTWAWLSGEMTLTQAGTTRDDPWEGHLSLTIWGSEE